jgi:hypothetical protein
MNTLISYLNWNVVTAALAVIGILIVALLAFRTFGGTVRGRRGARLAISEYHEVDKTRRLVLIRRDEVEHLLLIGGAQDVVIETGIGLEEAEEQAVYRPRTPASDPILAAPARRTEDTLRRDEGEAASPPVPPRQAPAAAGLWRQVAAEAQAGRP